jgi:hypothetical protein
MNVYMENPVLIVEIGARRTRHQVQANFNPNVVLVHCSTELIRQVGNRSEPVGIYGYAGV